MMKHIDKTPLIKKQKVCYTYAVPSESLQHFNESVAEAEAAYKLPIKERIQVLTYRYYSVRYGRYFED